MANLNINLLPGATAEDSKTIKLRKLLTRILTIGVAVFIGMSLVLSGILLFFSLQLRNVESQRQSVETAVRNLEDTERQVFFIQDRLAKIKTIQANDTLRQELEGFATVLDTLPSDAVLREADVTTGTINTVVEIKNPASMTAFLGQILTKGFSRINLREFNYNPTGGYLLTLIYYIPEK